MFEINSSDSILISTLNICFGTVRLYPKAGSSITSGWQKTFVQLYLTQKQDWFYNDLNQLNFTQKN